MLYDDTSWETVQFPTIGNVWKRHSDATRIFVDIQISMLSNSLCASDVEATEILGTPVSSVFYTPVQEGVYQQNLEGAKQTRDRRLGSKIHANHLCRVNEDDIQENEQREAAFKEQEG